AWIPGYAGYSADFFDGKHFVLKGASWATAAELVRPSFRNWYQAHYPYVFAKFRCVGSEKLAAGARVGRDEPVIDGLPVRVGEKRVDVLGALRRRVVEDEGVLPHIHYEDRREACHVADFVEGDPVVGQPSRVRVLIADGPAHAAHLAHADEGRLPRLERAEV